MGEGMWLKSIKSAKINMVRSVDLGAGPTSIQIPFGHLPALWTQASGRGSPAKWGSPFVDGDHDNNTGQDLCKG